MRGLGALSFIVVHVEFSVFEIVVAVLFRDLANHVAGIAEGEHIVRDVFRDDGACADHDVVTDRHSRHDTDISTDPDIVPDRDIDPVLISGVPCLRMKRVSCGAEHDIRSAHDIVPDGDLAHVQNDKVVVSKEILPDRDVVSIIAEERRLDAEVSLLGLSQDLTK